MIMYGGTHVTWFLAKGPAPHYRWTDPTGHVWYDGGAAANGESYFASSAPWDTPGIALPNTYRTLGGWWRVTMPGENIDMVIRQVDVGPLKPVIDLTAPLAFMLFTKEADFPDHTPWKAVFLGPVLPAGVEAGILNTKTGVRVPLEVK